MPLKDLRANKNWSQDDLAEASGLSVRTIQRIERDHKAGLESLKALAAAFNIETTELRKELNMNDENDVSDETYANSVLTFYAVSIGVVLMLLFLFLPSALKDPSNWGAFAMACVSYGVLVAMYAWYTFGDTWKKKIIRKRQQNR